MYSVLNTSTTCTICILFSLRVAPELYMYMYIIIIIIALQHSEDLYRVNEEQKLVNEDES